MRPRMKNPATIIPEAGQAIGALLTSLRRTGLAETTANLVHLRASQINGCSACVDGAARTAERTGEPTERLLTVAAWREAPYFSDAERGALALAEAVTRFSDRPDPVPDEVWADAAEHHTEEELAALILWIATTNLFNRLNVTTRQTPGAWH